MEIFQRRTNNLRKFSIVVPSRETDFPYLKNNLESYLNVESEEVLLCVDDDISQDFQNQIFSLYDSIKKKNNEISALEIIKVERREDFKFHQAWVRRKGFLKAKNDVILTGDIDLYINKKVTEAIKIVGKNEIGLASLQKFPLHSNLMGSFLTIWRLMYQMFLRATYYRVFTGLYALYRPYWLETEDDGIKNLKNVKYAGIKASTLGEDTYLRDCMNRKYRCVYLRSVGATDYGIALHDDPKMQFATGRYYFHKGMSLSGVLLASFTYFHPQSIAGYLYEKERVRKGIIKFGDVT